MCMHVIQGNIISSFIKIFRLMPIHFVNLPGRPPGTEKS